MKFRDEKNTNSFMDETNNKKDIGSNNIRTDLVNNIKEKVKKGYYNTTEVTEDLSDLFAKVFNNAV